MRIKLDAADKLFSEYIRRRDGRCMRCGKAGTPNKDGICIKGLENSHYHGRRKESVRFDPDNCDAMCFRCHLYLGSNPHCYQEWKMNQLGEERYGKLVKRANTPKKKNRKESLKEVKKLMEKLCTQQK